MSKYEEYKNMSISSTENAAKDLENWKSLLSLMGRLYKYPFEEQVLIHAQRPNATACASYPVWTNRMNRFIKKGSSGLALLDNESGKQNLKYVFDIEDTGTSKRRGSLEPNVWTVSSKNKDFIEEGLATKYELDENTIENVILGLAHKLSLRYSEINKDNILLSLEGSQLESFSNGSERVVLKKYTDCLYLATAYCLFNRCGINPQGYISDDEMGLTSVFNSFSTVSSLGNGISHVSEVVLREIESLNKSYEKSIIIAGRGEVNGEHTQESIINGGNGHRLHRGPGRNVLPQPTAGTDGQSLEQMGEHAQEVSTAGRKPPTVQPIGVEGGTVQPLPGDRGHSGRADRANDGEDNTKPGQQTSGTLQSDRPNGLGGENEQPPSPSRGADTQGTDLQLNLDDTNKEPSNMDGFNNVNGELPAQKIPPMFVVDWDAVQYDFDLNLYENGDIIAYDKDGVSFRAGKMGDFIYITTTTNINPIGDILGDKDIPSYIRVQMREYLNGDITADQVREENLQRLAAYKSMLKDKEISEKALSEGETVVAFNNEQKPLEQPPIDYPVGIAHSPLLKGWYEALGQDEELTYHLARGYNKMLEGGMSITRQRRFETAFEKMSAPILQQSKLSDAAYKVFDNKDVEITGQHSLGFGLLGNGITVWDRLNDNPQVGDYYSVAHISEEGEISWRVEDSYFAQPFRDVLKEQIQAHAEIQKQEWLEQTSSPMDNKLDNSQQEQDEPNRTPQVGDELYYNGELYRLDGLDGIMIKLYNLEENHATDIITTKERFFEDLQKDERNRHLFFTWEETLQEKKINQETPTHNDRPLQSNEYMENIDGVDFVFTSIGNAIGNTRQTSSPMDNKLSLEIPPEPQAQNFRLDSVDYADITTGGTKTKYNHNITAIRTLQTIENQNRKATQEEKELLSKYVGWGGIQEVFDSSKPNRSKEYEELKSLLSQDEYESGKASVLSAYYTSPTVIKAMYDALENLGFKDGNLLEPSMGVGNFFGMIPKSMSDAKLYGVELDSISGRIAKQLYPNADIKIMGYEETNMPDNFFDAAIGNVPFGSFGVNDKRYDKHKFMIHDYFFAKTLDQVRPGGVVAFVTSSGTLDKANNSVRKYIAEKAELLGAVRLPNNAFKANAGTDVTADIIFLQKRDHVIDVGSGYAGEEDEHDTNWLHLEKTEGGIPINAYFADNPHMVLGKMTLDSGKQMYGNKNIATCMPTPGADLAHQLKTALSHIKGKISEVELEDLTEDAQIRESIPADPNVKNFSYTLAEEKLFYREDSRMFLVDMPKTTMERIKGMVEIRDCVRNLLDMQLEDYSDQDIKAEQEVLNKLHEKFTKKHGLINSTGNRRAFKNDSSYSLISSLELLDEDKKLIGKAPIFTRRTVNKPINITHADTSTEALTISMGQKGKVDMGYMMALTDFTKEKIEKDLQGIIFKNVYVPGGGLDISSLNNPLFWDSQPYVTADEYLSGNVRQKLAITKSLEESYRNINADTANTLLFNVKALESVQPVDLQAGEIKVQLGSTWIDDKYIKEFVFDLLETSEYQKENINIGYSKVLGAWSVENKNYILNTDTLTNLTYGTKRRNAYDIISDTLNLKAVQIYDTILVYDPQTGKDKEKRVLNQKETALALEKQGIIKKKFEEWIFKDFDRREYLVEKYNKLFNSVKLRHYDGSHLNFTGMSEEIKLKEHQKTAIARTLYGGNTLLAHEVGLGKTFEMIAAAMESKRLGLCNKSLFVVPNHLTVWFIKVRH